MKMCVLPGDGIGPEITREAVRVLEALNSELNLGMKMETALLGGAAVDDSGEPYPETTRRLARAADAVLLGAVGGPRWDGLPREQRPERGLLEIRQDLGLFANLRPALLYPELAAASSLKPEIVSGLDILIVRELTGDIYFGQPRGIKTENGERVGLNTMIYSESEVRRIARVAFAAAHKRHKKLCSIDKMNVLESTQLWRDVVEECAAGFPEVQLTHMLVDNAAMQLVRDPKQFDVLLAGNMFGDILSDEAAMLTGSIGMLPSASLDTDNKGLYEPCHGSAPDIAGQDAANPLAAILSAAMLLRFSAGNESAASRVETAVRAVLAQGYRTADIYEPGTQKLGTRAMGDAVLQALAAH